MLVFEECKPKEWDGLRGLCDERCVECRRRFIAQEADRSSACITIGSDLGETTLDVGMAIGSDDSLGRAE
jgi:hypothetical protein